jgi:WD40 repeat protein
VGYDCDIKSVTNLKAEKEVTGGHPRPLNVIKLCKLLSHGNLLLTGGMEGHAKLWVGALASRTHLAYQMQDLRDRDPSIRRSFKHAAPVTSLAFCPNDPQQFIVGLENGSIHRYEMRSYQRPVGRIWGAHGNKGVMDLQWKIGEEGEGEHGSWLASAGADRSVQVCGDQGWQ